jgi:hypothetical protein
MAESSGENAGNLGPQPQSEVPKQDQEGQEASTERAIEQRKVSEGTPAKQTPKFPPQTAPPAPPPIQQHTQIPVQTPSQSASPSAGLHAKDADLIEKEWVQRAKNVISHTQDDPFKQKNEMSKMKVDYIKKRFNKSIPMDDSAKK